MVIFFRYEKCFLYGKGPKDSTDNDSISIGFFKTILHSVKESYTL